MEKQLHGWVPRRPSARIEHHLFGATDTQSETAGAASWLNWLAPAAALLIVCMLINQRNATPTIAKPNSLSGAILASNQNALLLIPGVFMAASNLSGGSFEWTNGNSSTSSISSLSASRGTN